MEYHRKHDRHAPRPWFNLFLRMGGWASLIFGVVLVVVTLIATTQLFVADRLDRDGRFTQAVVMDKRFSVSVDSDGDESITYYATFRFKTSEAGGQEHERSVGGGFYYENEIGDDVTVRYVRGDPDTFEHEIGQYRRAGNVLRWVGLLFGIAGLYTLWRFGNQTNDAIRARRFGEKRMAEVTGIVDTNVKVNDHRQARLTWREEDGQVGQSLMRDRGELSNLYRAGDKVVVFRLDEKAFWEGDVGPPAREM